MVLMQLIFLILVFNKIKLNNLFLISSEYKLLVGKKRLVKLLKLILLYY